MSYKQGEGITYMNNNALKKISLISLAAMMSVSLVESTMLSVSANTDIATRAIDASGYNVLGEVTSVDTDANKVTLSISTGEKVRFSFLDQNVFRMYMAPEGESFKEYPDANSKDHTATITSKTDAQYEAENKVRPVVVEKDGKITLATEKVTIEIDKATSMIKVMKSDGTVVWEESAPLKYKNGSTIQTLKTNNDEYFYGGGTQNGYFSHKGKEVKIATTNTWVDQSVASPNPFYWSTVGYGVVRNTWKPGSYDFGSKDAGTVTTTHNEKRFDAYYFIDDGAEALLGDYYDLTGTPAELPEYASYLGHLNCYNRDYWVPTTSGGIKLGDNYYKESQSDNGGKKETLLGDAEPTAQQIIEDHKANDMPLGWFLPNDGYGCGYGQTDSQAGDIQNLKDFSDYAISNGVQTGLWTQSNLWPADPTNPQKGERDIYKEVEAGVHSVKTDVAWVGAGYSMALNGISVAYDAIASRSNMKPNIVTLNGWAGTQRYGGIWSGDQSGGKWEYIRFHIPTYIGTGLSGQPNIGSDMDGIFGGQNSTIQTRDFQWKAFSTYMLDMDGWGSNQKTPWALGEDGTSINRTYLKLKAELTPYTNTISHTATAEGGLPMLRAMFLEEENPYTLGTATQYQYMWGDDFLVAPIYQETAMDADGNDIRNDIYLPATSDVWTDYFTGKQYRGGQVLNNFDAPLWKLPVFIKNGAIIPMYPENNNPEAVSETNDQGLDRSQRIVEFYPQGESTFDLYEDDGKTLGGASTSTTITSKVDNETLTLTSDKAVGTYTGMVKERSTEYIVNVSKAPKSVTGNVAGKDVTFTEADTLEAYENAEGNVYFYDATPAVLVKNYATEGTTYANIKDTAAPKLRIKSAEKVDITANAFSVTVQGFENVQDLGDDVLNTSIATPTGLKDKTITSESITTSWDAVADAVTYDIEVDKTVFRNIKTTEYTQYSLNYLTDHTYRVRAVTSNGNYSNWSDLVTIKTADDPYRNVPEANVTWTYGDQWGKVADAFDHNTESMFHSTGAVTPQQMMTLDFGSAFELDKFTYLPRTDYDGGKGNGVVQRMDVYASLDGVNYEKVWDGASEAAWDYTGQKGEGMMKTIDLTGVNARYLKLSIVKSTGGFFSASELTTYKIDGTKGWFVGDTNNSGGIEDNDLTFFENYVGLKQSDHDWNYANSLGNINRDDIIDAYDVSYVARQLGDAVTSKTAAKGVEGKIEIMPSKTDIKKGDIVTLDYYGIGMKNVNAFSVELPVDQDLFEVVSFGSPALKSMFMRNFSKTRFHNDGKVDNYVIFTNVGKQELLSGTGNIAKVTIRANKDFTWDTTATRANVIGQDLSVGDALIDNTIVPEVPETENILSKNNIKSITFKNDVKESLTGEELFQQSNWKDLLFDGDKTGSLVEFKWFTDTSTPDDYVKVPTDMIFNFTKKEPLKSVRVYNRSNGSNGSVKKIKAVGYDGDTAYDLGSYSAFQSVFEFAVPAAASNIDRVVITPEETSGTATTAEEGKRANRMMSLFEIEFVTNSEVKASGIKFTETSPSKVYVGGIAQVEATVAPSNATNPLYTVTSSDESIAKVVQIPTATNYIYCVQGIAPGTVTLTATSADGSFTTTKEITVVGGVNTSVLESQLAEFDALYGNIYTKDSYDAVSVIATEARAIMDKTDSTQNDIDTVTLKLVESMKKLEFKGSNSDQATSEDVIANTDFTLYDESSFTAAEKEHGTNAFDGSLNTLWHSNYNTGYTLPQWITVDLGAEYNLEQVDYFARQGGRNGHITHYRIELATESDMRDGELNFKPVVEGYLPNDGYSLDNPSDAKEIKFDKTAARYVRFMAIEALGDTPNSYASIAELNFFGKKTSVNPENALAEAERVLDQEETMTTSSWTTFMNAYDALVALMNNENASDAELSLAATNVMNAIDGLVRKASSSVITTLVDLVADAKGMEADYTEAEFADVKAAITAAEAVLAKDANEITSAEATMATMNLVEAIAELNSSPNVLLRNLTKTIANANAILEDEGISNKRPAKVQALKDAVLAAQALVDNGSTDTDAIMTAISSITKAAQELYNIVDKTELSTVIERAEALKEGNYSSDTWTALLKAVADAKLVVANDDATTAEVDTAYKNVVAATKNLAPIVNRDALEVQIAEAESIVENIDKYISSTVAGLKDLLAEAKAVFADEMATQKSINDMSDALTKANMKARLKADTTKLVEAMNRARSIDLSNYTADSAMALTNVLANADALMNDEYADEASIDAMSVAIDQAIEKLVKKDLSNETKPESPSTGNDSTTAPEAGTNKNTNTNKKPIVATGDATNAMGLAGIGAAAAAVFVFVRKKLKNKK